MCFALGLPALAWLLSQTTPVEVALGTGAVISAREFGGADRPGRLLGLSYLPTV